MTRPIFEAPQAAQQALLVRARWILLADAGWRAGAALLIRKGRIERVATSEKSLGRMSGVRRVDLGDVALAPGYVNAHAHLELSGLKDALPRAASFSVWIRALIQARSEPARAPSAIHTRSGADRLLATGTTLVGDIQASAEGAAGLRGHPLRVRAYREVLDAGDPARADAALERLALPTRRSSRRYPGISPHAPYTLSDRLLCELASRVGRSRSQLAIHWAETLEEVEWLRDARGPMSALLTHSPRSGGLERLHRLGLLGPRTALVHANHPDTGDLELVARARATIVHCPGTHAFFGRTTFDPAPWFARGVPVALGTDSLASNEDLDMGREMALFRRAHPAVAPATVLAMATSAGASAVGFAERAGRLAPGFHADFALHELGAPSARALDEALSWGESRIQEVWIGGRRVHPRGTRGSDACVC